MKGVLTKTKKSSSIVWTSCVICQQTSSEQHPQWTSKYDPLTMCENFISNVEECKKLDGVHVELV